MDEAYEKCSLCGNTTDILVGCARSKWYLCNDCVGTEEAENAGFTHRNKWDILEEHWVKKRGSRGELLATLNTVDLSGLFPIKEKGNG